MYSRYLIRKHASQLDARLRRAACAAFLAIGLAAVPAGAQIFTEYVTPTASSVPSGITVGPDGNLWFVESSASKIGKITPGGTFTEYPLTPGANPIDIAAGPDGNLWYTQQLANSIGQITPTGTVTEYALPSPDSHLFDIVLGPDGNLWFTENDSSSHRIGTITPAGVITEYDVPTPGNGPWGITSGPDGNLWFTEPVANKIGKVTPTGTFTEYSVPTAASLPLEITTGADGNLWFIESNANKIGRVTPTGTFTEFNIPSLSNSGAIGITVGPEGNIWFTETNTNKIGRLTPAIGLFAEFSIPTVGYPYSIVTGPDGNLWFTENNASQIAKFEPPPCGDGVIVSGEECDDGNTVAGDCCSPTCHFEPSSTVCRAAASECDIAETCTGMSAACPADTVKPDGVACTDDADPCTPPVCSQGVCIQVDTDADGVGDLCDNCPLAANASQVNSDCDDPTFLPSGGCTTDPSAKPGCCDGGDVCDACPLSADNTNCNGSGTTSGEIGAAGAQLTAPDHTVSLDVPFGAVAGTTTVSIIQNAAPVSSPLVVNNVTMNPPQQTFQQPVTLTFRWKDRDGDHKVDTGTCQGDMDDGKSCDADEDCDSHNCTVHDSDTPELDLTLQRDGRRFSAMGFGVGPFTCADHLAGPGAPCATAVANCNDDAGTGTATVANCCDPDTNTWSFQTCNFNPTVITQPGLGLMRSGPVTADTGVATAALQPRYAVLVPGLGSASTDCHAEWGPKGAEYNKPATVAPKPPPPHDALNVGVLNAVQTCQNGDGSCDATAGNDCKCRFIVKLSFNVADPRLRRAAGCKPPVSLGHQADPPPVGCYACGPSSIAKWTLKSPKPTDPIWGDVGQALIAAMIDLGGVSQSTENPAELTFVTSADGEPDTEEVLVDVPVKGKAGKMKAGKLTIRMQSETTGGAKDNDKLQLVCEPSGNEPATCP